MVIPCDPPEVTQDFSMIEVLDYGFVRLVDYMGSDINVVRAARVSYEAAWRAGEDEGSDAKLIRYLWRNHHTSPFEAVTFTFEIKAPIFVLRQWHRHRTWSYNELSARYRELPEEFYLPEVSAVGIQATKNKQGREASTDEATRLRREIDIDLLDEHCRECFHVYKQLLASGWPRELARMALPLNTYSHMFATVNLLNLMKFFALRSDPHAQYEIRVYSDAMKELVRKVVPVCMEAYEATQ